jgi:hypothetical protein
LALVGVEDFEDLVVVVVFLRMNEA